MSIDPNNIRISDYASLKANNKKEKLEDEKKAEEKKLVEESYVNFVNNLYPEREQASASAEAITQARANPEFAEAIVNDVWHSLSNTNDYRSETIIKELKRIAQNAVEDSKFLAALNRDLDDLNII